MTQLSPTNWLTSTVEGSAWKSATCRPTKSTSTCSVTSWATVPSHSRSGSTRKRGCRRCAWTSGRSERITSGFSRSTLSLGPAASEDAAAASSGWGLSDSLSGRPAALIIPITPLGATPATGWPITPATTSPARRRFAPPAAAAASSAAPPAATPTTCRSCEPAAVSTGPRLSPSLPAAVTHSSSSPASAAVGRGCWQAAAPAAAPAAASC